MKRLWTAGVLIVGIVLLLASGAGLVAGQGGPACPLIVETALNMAGQLCAGLGRNEACYGHARMEAEPQPGVEGFSFANLGDRTGVDTLGRLRLSPLSEANGVWGVALLKVQANLPDTLPGQNVTLVLFGDAELQPQASGGGTAADQPGALILVAGSVIVDQPSLAGMPVHGPLAADTPFIAEGRLADNLWLLVRLPEGGTGWVVSQAAVGTLDALPIVDESGQAAGGSTGGGASAFYFASGMDDAPCAAAPDSGLLIQTPAGATEVALSFDGVDISLASTAYLQARPGGELWVSVLEGQASVTAQGATQVVPAGWRTRLPLGADGLAAGQPLPPEPYDPARLSALPLGLLERPITIAEAGSGTAGGTGQTTCGGSGGPNLIDNGDFALGFEGWEMVQECDSCGMQTNLDPDPRLGDYLAWQRDTGGGRSGAAIWARQPLNIDMRECTDLHIGFDVRVDNHSLTNSGWYSDEHGGNGEYPVLVRLAFMPAFQGSQFDWARGFLTTHDGTTTLRNYTIVTAGQWTHFEADVQSAEQWVDGFGMVLTNPGVLTDIYVGGSGWDFTGAIDNLVLTGTNCPRNLP